MTKPKTKYNISEDLLPLAHPVDNLKLLPGNPRRGDVQSVKASLEKYGQVKPIVGRVEENGDEIVLAGNTTLTAARELGWTHVAVTWASQLDDKRAVGFALADNRTHDLGEYDNDALLDMIATVKDDEPLFASTGYDDDFVLSLLSDEPDVAVGLDDEDDEQDEDDVEDEPSAPRPPGNPVVQYAIIFDDEPQQQLWCSFVRWLKRTYPDHDTVAGRLNEFLEGIVPQED